MHAQLRENEIVFLSRMCPRDTINHRRTRYYHRKHGTSQRDHENEEEEEANRAKDDDRLLLNRHLLDGFLHRR